MARLGRSCLTPKLVTLCAGALAIIASPALQAQPAAMSVTPDHQVILNSGTILEAQLVELIPNEVIVLRLTTGEIQRVPWAEIKSQRAYNSYLLPVIANLAPKSAVATPTLSGPLMPTVVLPPSLSIRDPGLVKLHLETNRADAKLYRKHDERFMPVGTAPVDGYYDWEEACEGTCDVELLRRDRYRIQGFGIRTSPEFHLPLTPKGELTLRVRAGTTADRNIGAALTSIGTPLTVFGAVTLGVFLSSPSRETQSLDTRMIALGGTMLGGGVVMMIPGIFLLVTRKTKVSTDVGSLEYLQ